MRTNSRPSVPKLGGLGYALGSFANAHVLLTLCPLLQATGVARLQRRGAGSDAELALSRLRVGGVK